VKVEKEDIFKLAVEDEDIHEISDDSGVGPINFATSRIC
jgi:hypothetical protein